MKGIFNVLGWAVFWLAIIISTVFIGLIPFALVAVFTFLGAKKRHSQVIMKLSTTLMQGEEVITQAVQHRVFALWHRRVMLAITNSRVVIIERGVLGGFKMKDIQWKDLHDVKLEQNVLSQYCGSNIVFKNVNVSTGTIEINGVPDQEASEIYSKSQAEEQAWEEKRRVRAIEEARAAAGGVIVHAGAQQSASPAPTSNAMLEQIANAKRLLDSGTISDAEFQEMKSKIISAS